jgi:hypothetical protein
MVAGRFVPWPGPQRKRHLKGELMDSRIMRLLPDTGPVVLRDAVAVDYRSQPYGPLWAKQPWQRWQTQHKWQLRIYNLQTSINPAGFDPHLGHHNRINYLASPCRWDRNLPLSCRPCKLLIFLEIPPRRDAIYNNVRWPIAAQVFISVNSEHGSRSHWRTNSCNPQKALS